MRETRRVVPEIEAKALRFIEAGYQKLLTFEAATGGFSWFGESPGNVQVTAYGVMEFSDMSRVRYVDPAVISRTIDWLLRMQNADGSWPASATHGSSAFDNGSSLRATAYVAFALGEAGYRGDAAAKALAFMMANLSGCSDPYTLALCANAILVHAPSDADGLALLARLYDMRREEGSKAWWSTQGSGAFGSGTDIASLETTAYAAFALARARSYRCVLAGVADYIAGRKDSFGNYGTTHATVLSLKALMAIGGSSEIDLALDVDVNGCRAGSVRITRENLDVLHMFDAGPLFRAGANSLTFAHRGSGRVEYHVGGASHVPWSGARVPQNMLELRVSHDRLSLKAGEAARHCVAIGNANPSKSVFMPVAIVALPPGFRAVREDLDALVASGKADKYEIGDSGVTLYLKAIPPAAQVELSFRSMPGIPGELRSGESIAFEYYSPEVRASAASSIFTVTAGK